MTISRIPVPEGGGGSGGGISDVTADYPLLATSPSATTRNIELTAFPPTDYERFPSGVMSNFARRRIAMTVSGATGGPTSYAQTSSVTSGSATNPGLTNTTYFTSAARYHITSTVAVDVRAGLALTGNEVFRGNIADTGGFIFECVFGVTAINTTSRFFCGLSAAAVTLAADPSSLTDVLGLGFDSADANFQWIHNDSSGSATKVDLGSTFPRPSGAALSRDIYQVIIACHPNDSSVSVFVSRRDDETITPDSRSLATHLPTASTALLQNVALGTGPSTSTAVTLAFMREMCETTL
jgi:hypothetical protein